MAKRSGIKSFRVLEPNKLVQDLIAYLENKLPEFIHSDESKDVLITKKNENQHSLAFCLYMTNECKSKFCFQRENAQKGSHTVDIGVYSGSNLFFTIEAKKLPTPTDKNRHDYEYVYGKSGGIQRFKDGNHGVDNEDNYLMTNGLIAYIYKLDFTYWEGKVNEWINDAGWNKSEKLRKTYFNSIGRLKSKHTRQDNSEVHLEHFWVDISKNEKPN